MKFLKWLVALSIIFLFMGGVFSMELSNMNSGVYEVDAMLVPTNTPDPHPEVGQKSGGNIENGSGVWTWVPIRYRVTETDEEGNPISFLWIPRVLPEDYRDPYGPDGTELNANDMTNQEPNEGYGSPRVYLNMKNWEFSDNAACQFDEFFYYVGDSIDDLYDTRLPLHDSGIVPNAYYIYQKQITFKVVNGAWDEGEGEAATADKTVTLTGYEGDTLKLSADQIPAVGNKPDDTYKAGSWDTEPGTETAITTDTTYTYTYAQWTPITTNVSLNKTKMELATKSSVTLKATVTPANADKTLTWKSSNPSVVSVNSNGKITAKKYGKATITATTVSGKTAKCVVQTRFYDVNVPGKSYYDPVYWAVDNKITKCSVAFRPEDGVTRGEFTAFLYRLAGSPTVTASMKKAVRFTDVNSSTQFYNEICWAVSKGIIKGFKDNTFRPMDGLTREQCAVMIWRYAGKPEVSLTAQPFPDVKLSNADSCKAIAWGSQNGIMNGSGGKFQPKKECTRAHVVTFLHRYAE